MTLKESCCCGASFEVTSGASLRGGGRADPKGRIYIAEVHLDKFRVEHARCQPGKRGYSAADAQASLNL